MIIISSIIYIIAGIANGFKEAYTAEPSIFGSRFKANPDGWWGSKSWKNKYKNKDPYQGEAFIGSTSIFVVFTDLNHFSGMLRTLGLVLATYFASTGEYDYIKVLGGVVIYGLCSHITYNLIRYKTIF